MENRRYGLLTVIGMIVGVVIGSGIFFKSDNILIATGGSISLGVLVFCIAAMGIIFGSLSISELASRNTDAGGIITYAEYSYNKSIACAFGWFHSLLYYPTLIAVVSWVAGNYMCILFNIEGTLENQILIGLAIMVTLFISNTLSGKFGGYFQNASTIIKIIPLVVIALAGIIFGDSNVIILSDVTSMQSFGWIAAIAPIAFSFDGWIVATSVGHEIKDSQKNLPKALIVAPLIILALYLAYFVGISIYMGPETIMAYPDTHIEMAAERIFGQQGAKIILIFVVVSIMGTVNGLVIGLTRKPYSLAIRKMFPYHEILSKIDKKTGIPTQSAIVAFIISLAWLGAHYLTQKFSLLPNSDISEISITINYVLYILLYAKVFKMGRSGEIKGIWRGTINPILATVGSLIILMGSIGNTLFWGYASICLAILVSAMVFWKYQSDKLGIE